MEKPEYLISSEIFASYPNYCRGVVVIDAVDNRGGGEDLVHLLREAEMAVRVLVRGNVAELPYIAAWREAYRRFGAKPSEHRSSIEAMVRRVIKPESIPSINPLVDIGNLVSLRYMLPVGVHPLTEPLRSIELRCSLPGDTFVPVNREPEETPPAGEIVLASGQNVLTRRWTWRQAANTQTLPGATRVFYNVDGLPPATKNVVSDAMQEIVRVVNEHCGGTVVATALLTQDRPSLPLAFE